MMLLLIFFLLCIGLAWITLGGMIALLRDFRTRRIERAERRAQRHWSLR